MSSIRILLAVVCCSLMYGSNARESFPVVFSFMPKCQYDHYFIFKASIFDESEESAHQLVVESTPIPIEKNHQMLLSGMTDPNSSRESGLYYYTVIHNCSDNSVLLKIEKHVGEFLATYPARFSGGNDLYNKGEPIPPAEAAAFIEHANKYF